MRLLRLDLLLWGHFEGTSLDLSAPKLHVIYGPNEAGKSTTRRAVHALLFGVPRGSDDAFAVGKATLLRLGGLVADDRGNSLDFVRKGGVKDTIVSPGDGAVVPEDTLRRVRGALSADTFATVFSIDHTSLTEGASAILESGGDLGESLAVAALGTRELTRARAVLEERETKLYNPQPQASRTELHGAMRQLREERTRQENAESSPEAFAAQERALTDARSAHRAIAIETAEKRREAEALDEAIRSRPVLDALATVRARIAELAHVPSLPAGLEVDHARAASEGRSASTRLRVLVTEREELLETARLRAASLLDDALVQRLGEAERGLLALEARDTRRRELLRQQEAILRQITRARESLGAAAENARALVSSRATTTRLADDAALKRRNLEVTRRQARDAESALADLPPPRGEELTLEVAPLEALGGLDETSAQALRAVAEAKRDHDGHAAKVAALVRTTFVTRPSVEALVTSSLPSRERLVEVVEDLVSIRENRKSLVREAALARERLAKVRERLAIESSTTPAVTEDDLRKARHTRDTYVTQLAVFPSRLEETVRVVAQADALADRMRHEVDRVLRHVELAEEERSLDARISEIAASVAALETNLVAVGRDELEAARALGGNPGDVEGLPAFRAKVDAVIEVERALEEARVHLARTEATCAALAAAYARPLALDPTLPLSELRARANERRDALRAELVLEQARMEGRKKHLAERKAALARERTETQELRAVERTLGEALDAAGLAKGASADDVRARLDELAELLRARDAADEIAADVRALDAEDAAFEADLTPMVEAAASPKSGGLAPPERTRGLAPPERTRGLAPPERTRGLAVRAAALVARLAEAARARDAARRDAEALVKNERETRSLDVLVRDTTSRVRHALDVAGATDDASFASIVRLASEKEGLVRRADELEGELSRLLRRTDRAEIDTILRDRSLEELDSSLANLEADLAMLDAEAKTALEAAGRNEQGLEQFKNQDLGAARAAEDAELAFARVVRVAEDWLSVRAARRLLAKRIETYRKESQGPVLERASRHFRALTLGAYEGLSVELADDPSRTRRGDEATTLALHAVRAPSEEGRRGAPLAVSELSTGTRDQLYFALRVASLERLASLGSRAPIVLDDALVHFDDDRARAAFGVLGALAKEGTVLFLTHHTRMRDLAEEALGPGGAIVHTLTK